MANARGPVRQVILRIPEALYAEMILLNPDLVDPVGDQVRYGGHQQYFLRLLTLDLERKREALRNAATAAEEKKDETA